MKNVYTILAAAAMMCCVSVGALATEPLSSSEKNYWDDNNETLQLCALARIINGNCTIEATYISENVTYTVSEIGDGKSSVSASGNTHKTCTALTINANAKMNDNAFKTWSDLTTVTIGVEEPMEIGENVFPASVEKIVVPAGQAKVFAEAAGWSAYADVIEDVDGKKATGIEDVEMGEKVVVAGNVIKLAGEGHIVVTELTGRSIDCGVRSSYVIEGSGLYIVTVKMGEEMITKRVLVR